MVAAGAEKVREIIARLDWRLTGGLFRLERTQPFDGDRARLVLPNGQTVELGKSEWDHLAIAIRRLLPDDPETRVRTEDRGNRGKPWSTELDRQLRAAWEESEKNRGAVRGLARRFGRTELSIEARLIRIGLAERGGMGTRASRLWGSTGSRA